MTNLRRRPPADDPEPEHAAGSSNPGGQTMEVKFADFGGGHVHRCGEFDLQPPDD